METKRKNDGSNTLYIQDILRWVWKRKLPILLGAILGAAALFALSRCCMTPLYEASVTLYVNNSSSKENTGYITQSDLYASSQLVETYAVIILSDAILEDVLDKTSLEMTLDELADLLKINSVNGTEVFRVSVRYTDPETAAEIVDSVAEIVPERIANIVKGSSVSVINYARIPEDIAYPNYKLMALIGFAAGAVLVCGYFLIRELLNDRVRNVSDFSRWGYPLLASVPDFFDKKQDPYGYYRKNGAKKKTVRGQDAFDCLLTEEEPFGVQEAHKMLRTNIIFASPDQEKKIIIVTSAQQREAKTTTAINLAAAFAQNQSRVLLMDCDLRLPAAAGRLGIRAVPGLTELVLGKEMDGSVIRALKTGLHVLPSGTIPPNPTELLGSKKMEQLLDQLTERYDYIIMDTPPMETMPDSIILSKFATDIILVVRQSVAEKADIDAVIRKLELAKAKVLGFVFTCVTENEKRSYKKYGYIYRGSRYGKKDSTRERGQR